MPENTNQSPLQCFLTQYSEVCKHLGLVKYMDADTALAFSLTCRAAERISPKSHKEMLLSAVVEGDEAKSSIIITYRPELILDASIAVKDLSGKEIKNLTPLQAAICAGDTDMLQMMKDVLYQKLQQDGKVLGCKNKLELDSLIRCQFEAIYPNGIDAVEAEQQAKAQEFKDSTLQDLFAAINNATPEQVRFELDTPGQHQDNPNGLLNAVLHEFRNQFTTTSNSEQIFNPYYLLEAFEFYDERFNNFTGNENDQWSRRNLFWRQVVGYTQRHLPACLLQAFAQGIYDIVENGEKLKRDFEFKYDKGFYMHSNTGDLNNLGYKYAGVGQRLPPRVSWAAPYGLRLRNYGEQKNHVWRTYLRSQSGNDCSSTCRPRLAP